MLGFLQKQSPGRDAKTKAGNDRFLLLVGGPVLAQLLEGFSPVPTRGKKL